MYKLKFNLPGLPKTANGSHGHWRTAAAERKKWRSAVSSSAFYFRPPAPLARARITLTRLSSSKPDFDNLVISFKPIVDGLKDAKIILDDSDSVVLERCYLWEKAKPKSGGVRVFVEEI